MNLPPGVTEDQVLAAIENAVRILAPSFTFGIYDLEDIKQEARMMGLEAMDRYDPERPLENFLYSHIRNRLSNLKRNKYRRNDPPCLLCHHAEGNRSLHETGEFCRCYVEWKKRNDSKANIMRPLDIDHIADENESNTMMPSEVEETVELNEMLHLIDEHLDVDLRAAYLQLRAGKSVPKARRAQVEAAIREILRDALEAEDAG